MQSAYQGISDIFFNACGSYLDATECKQCTPSIFTEPSMDMQEYSESRVDNLQERSTIDDSSSRHPFDRMDDSMISLSGLLIPYLPASSPGGSNYNRSRIRRNTLDQDDDIFRLQNSKPAAIESDQDVVELNRCKAWSQDSDRGALDSSSFRSNRMGTKLKLIHWDETIEESNGLSNLIV